MDLENLFLHIRTGQDRHSLLLNRLRAQVEKTITAFSQLNILDIGPGGLPKGSAGKSDAGTLDSFLTHMKQKVTADLENYEPRRFAKRFALRYNVTETVVDNYEPCLSCVPDSFLYNFNNAPTNLSAYGMRKVAVKKVKHDISEPFPDGIGLFDVVLTAIVIDWIPHDDWRSWRSLPNKFKGFFTTARQEDAVRNIDALIKPGGYWGVSLGKDAPRWDLLLDKGYTLIDDSYLPPGYNIWRKKEISSGKIPKRIFEPPRNIPVSVQTGRDTSQPSTFPRSTSYTQSKNVEQIE